jgi:hypothetical protein
MFTEVAASGKHTCNIAILPLQHCSCNIAIATAYCGNVAQLIADCSKGQSRLIQV